MNNTRGENNAHLKGALERVLDARGATAHTPKAAQKTSPGRTATAAARRKQRLPGAGWDPREPGG